MTSRSVLRAAVFALGVGSLGSPLSVSAQGAPFTIRRPPDGATVREKVRVEIPRSSIREGGFVAFYLDDKFFVAQSPPEDGSMSKPFTFVWDTKAGAVSDGEHTVRAVLFEPASGAKGISVTEKGSSEVKLTIANKIRGNPGPLTLRYKYRDGQNLEYSRDGKTLIAGGVSETGSTDDQDIASVRSRLLLGIEDARPDVSLVRNKLTSLTILTGGPETAFDPNQLSASMYQELDSRGRVLYETGSGSGLTEYMAQGLPVNNTLELPLLPSTSVVIGQTWRTPSQRLDIPGVPPALQPRVTLDNKLVGLEWESGYPTAKIHQTYTQGASLNSVVIGGLEITAPTVTYERDIYLAYKSGTLIRTARTLTIKGRTTANLNNAAPSQGAGPSAGGYGGYGGAPAGASGGYGSQYGGKRGGVGAGGPTPGAGGYGSQYGGGRGGYGGAPQGSGYGGGRGAGMQGGGYGGYGGAPQGAGGGYGSQYGGGRGRMGGYGGPPQGAGGGYGAQFGARNGGGYGGYGGQASNNNGGASNAETDHTITVKAITNTQLITGVK